MNKKRITIISVVSAAVVFCAGAVACALFLAQPAFAKSKINEAEEETISNGNQRFSVISVVPEDELPATVRHPAIQVQFSEPVVPLKKLGEPSDVSDVFTIEPKLEGVYRWYGTSLLSFECSDTIAPQKEYKISINPNLTSVDGQKISGKLNYSFTTERLALTGLTPCYEYIKAGRGYWNSWTAVPVEAGRDVAVYFNYPVDVNYVSKFISVYSKKPNKTYTFTATQEKERVIRIKINETLPESAEIFVELAKGASSDADSIPCTKATRSSYRTIDPFAISYISEGYYSEHSNPICIYMNSNVTLGSEEEIAKHISTDPAMTITKDNIEISNRTITVFDLPVDFGSEYTLKVDADLTDFYGRKLGKEYSQHVEVPQAASFVRFKDYGFKILEAQYVPKLIFQFQNIHNGKYKLAELNWGSRILGKETEKTYDGESLPKNQKLLELVDLKDHLKKAGAQYHGAVKFTSSFYTYYYNYKNERVVSRYPTENQQVIQVTDLGITARYGYNKMDVLVSTMSTGLPVKNAKVNVYYYSGDTYELMEDQIVWGRAPEASGYTDANGFVSIAFPYDFRNGSVYVEAITSNDRCIFSPNNTNMWSTSAEVSDRDSVLNSERHTFMFTDRGLYKPGEKVTFRGIDRNLQKGKYTPYSGGYKIEITNGSWRPTVYKSYTGLKTTANGTFWGEYQIPDDMEPGDYQIRYTRDDGRYESLWFTVQYFERLRFESKVNIASELTYYTGDDLNAEISANYLGGGSMNDCYVESSWSRASSYFTSPDKRYSEGYAYGPQSRYDGTTTISQDEGRLNGEGKSNISVSTGGEKVKGVPYVYRAMATVMDSGDQAITSSASATVHSSKFYLGVSSYKNLRGFPKKNETLRFDYILQTPNGEIPSADLVGKNKKMRIELSREEWKEIQQVSWDGSIYDRWESEIVVEEDKEIALSASTSPQEFSVTPKSGGYYTLRVTTTDSLDNEVITERSFYVVSSDWYWWNRNNAEEITLTTDKSQYQVGDTAQILMQSPLPKGYYMITVEREGLISEEVRKIDSPTSVLEVNIKESYVPVMYVTVSSYSVRSGDTAPDFYTPDVNKPKSYFGLARLHVSTDTRTFNVEVKKDKPSYKPGEKATFTLRAVTKDGKPLANTELTLMAVDRGVVDLIDYHVPDPVEYFYNEDLFPDAVKGGDSRYLLMDPVTYKVKNLQGGDADEKLNERSNFNPLAVFEPSLVTDSNGYVKATFKLPDTLTSYRLTVVGVKEDKFARIEDQFDVANPVSVRQVLPRELRLNDVGEVGVVISNLQDKAQSVNIELNVYPGLTRSGMVQSSGEIQKLPGKVEIQGGAKKKIDVPAERTDPLMFMIKAVEPGWVTLEFTVRSSAVNEKLIVPLQIQKPYIYENVTTVGELRSDDGKPVNLTEKIILPSDADDGMGSLKVILDSNRLGALSESVDYLFHYPYGCMEQRSSAILPLTIFGNYIDVFGLNSEVLDPSSVVVNEVKSWAKVQKNDGGFPYWPSGSYSNLMVSTRIGEIVAIGDKKGLELSSYLNKKKLANYILNGANEMMRNAERYGYRGGWYEYEAAYCYYVASLLGENVNNSTLEKLEKSKYAEVDTLCFVGLTYVNNGQALRAKKITSRILPYTKRTTRGIEITAMTHEGWYSSEGFTRGRIENYALLLQLYSETDVKNSINQNLLYEILLMQKAYGGHYQSTASTARVLNAINVYIEANDLENTNFTAEALLNGKKLMDGKFVGLGTKPVEKTFHFLEKPLSDIKRDTEQNLKFTKTGDGILFYTATLKYALPADQQKARDEGLCLYTEVIDVKTGKVVKDNQLEEGKVYKEVVHISSTRDREFVAMRIPVPAGCEIINAAFATNGSGSSFDGVGEYSYDTYSWGLSNQAIYNTEVQYFYNTFYRGSQQVSFLFRAGRKGTYNVPSALAECMYQEEIFGRTDGAVWTIK